MHLLFGEPPFLTLIAGAKASGKSEVVKYICYSYRERFHNIIVISPTALNGFFDFLPKERVFDAYDPAIIADVFKRQEAFKRAKESVHTLLIFDDVLADEEIRLSRRVTELNKLFSANRHYNISAIFVSQKLRALPVLLRENVDYAVIGRVINSAYDPLYETFSHTDKKSFRRMLEDNTRDYSFVLYRAQGDEHWSTFKIPPGFRQKKFKLVF